MIEHFFESHNPGLAELNTTPGSLGKQIVNAHQNGFHLPQNAVVLFSVGANPLAWRQALYNLADWHTKTPIIDLGLFLCSGQRNNDLQGLNQVLQILNEKQAVVCALDHTDLLPLAQLRFMKDGEQPSEWSCIAPNMEAPALQQCLENLHEAQDLPWCLRFNRIANQEFYVRNQDLKLWQHILSDDLSVGGFREDPTRAEPLLRNAHSVTFLLDALKSREYGDPTRHNPSGLNSEEACKLMWYAGMGNQLRNVSLSHLGSTPMSQHTAELLAQMTWYFCKGASLKPADMPDENNAEFRIIRCPATEINEDEELVFLLNTDTQRVWIQIPIKGQNHWMACHYHDLVQAQEGTLPKIWFHNLKLR